jgi:cobalt-zinc-cadmium efflux system outer membrane protein
MRTTLVLRLVVAAVVCGHPAAHAETHNLSFEKVLALARERGPAATSARYRVAEARGRRIGAGRLLPEDPELAFAAGRRRGEGEPSNDFEVELTQRFEVGGKRSARVAAADAEIERASAEADGASRAAQLEAAELFFAILHATEVERLYAADAEATSRLVAVTQARSKRGEAIDLDLQLARIASARAAAAAATASAARVEAESQLAAVLGFAVQDELKLVGDLATVPPAARPPTDLRSHPAVRAAAAAEHVGRAEQRLGERLRWPDLGLRVSYAREERDTILLGGLVLRLPLVERGQELRATGDARARAAAADGRTTADALHRRAVAMQKRLSILRAAVEQLDRDGVPALVEAERLVARSFEQGVIDLRDLLTTRRELVAARIEVADRRLTYAVAASQALLFQPGRTP